METVAQQSSPNIWSDKQNILRNESTTLNQLWSITGPGTKRKKYNTSISE